VVLRADMTSLPISATVKQRFSTAWESLLPIGRDADTGGYRRYAWTPADLACRAWFQEQAHARGLTVERDAAGNLMAWWDAGTPDRRGAVLTGSHLDSVPDGGAFDGPLGVLAGLCAVDLLRERGVAPNRALAVAVFTDEEGARFGLACIGSRLLSGTMELPAAYALQDTSGTTMRDAMLAAGVDVNSTTAIPDVSQFSAFVELHIEQGRGLADLDSSIALGTAIWPHGRWRYAFRGEANHAGTTRLIDRHDPMLPFAATALGARQIATDTGGLATFGRVSVEPNATNGVPSAALAWLDARAPDSSTLEALVNTIASEAASVAKAHDVSLEITSESSTPEVRFDSELRARMAGALAGDGPVLPELSTGAGHDAGILAGSIPTGMLFVRNRTGVSHSPMEHADLEDCLDGVSALATVLEELLCR
jgi:beta-ureidopropionase / N-carbamoyl-L-amino-acid hydrolase